MKVDGVSYWMDRPITELTRDELIEAVEQLAHMLEREWEDHRTSLQVWSDIAGSRR